MPAFTLVWFGQLVSLVGTNMTLFALTIWVWQITGEATALALMGFFSFGPTVLFSPIAGALVDRWNRKLVMMLSDLAAGLSTLTILVLYSMDHLQVWHLYVAGAFAGTFESFQWPAYSAAVTTMLDKEQYARASGMLSFARSAANIFGPLLAGALLGVIGITGILTIDAVTFVIAILALLLVYIPQPPRNAADEGDGGNIWKESIYGFRYIFARSSLLGLQLVIFAGNLSAAFGFTVLAPMILARTENNAAVLGTVQSALGVGGLLSGIFLSVWGGPRRRVHGILIGLVLESLGGTLLMGLGRELVVWTLAAFLFHFFIPIINGSNQAIWQTKVPPHVQGRVFAARGVIAQITVPLAFLLAGPLADRVFEPAMGAGGWLAPIFGGVVGVGPGAGMALMFVITGVAGGLAGAAGYTIQAVREIETALPDHDEPGALPAEPSSFPDIAPAYQSIDGRRLSEQEPLVLRHLQRRAVRLLEENRKLRTKLEERDAWLSTLSRLSLWPDGNKSRSDLLEDFRRVLRAGITVTRATEASLLLMDDETGELVFTVVIGELEPLLAGYRLPPGEGIAGWVAENRLPQLVSDAHRDPRFSLLIDETFSFRTYSLLAVPLVERGETLGVIEVVNKFSERDFSEEDLHLWTTAAQMVARAIARPERVVR